MAGKFPVGKPKLPSWTLPLLAVSLTLLVHALWLVLPQSRISRPPLPESFRLTAYPNLEAKTWSPTLFSLPSALGFSGAIRQRTSVVRPPLQSPVKLSEVKPVELSEVFSEPGLDLPLFMPSRQPVTVSSLPSESPKESGVSGWRFQVLEGPETRVELNRLPPPPEGEKALVLGGVLTYDAGGQLQSLFLDPVNLSAEQRTQILRALRRVRIENGSEGGRIRFRFAYGPVEESL